MTGAATGPLMHRSRRSRAVNGAAAPKSLACHQRRGGTTERVTGSAPGTGEFAMERYGPLHNYDRAWHRTDLLPRRLMSAHRAIVLQKSQMVSRWFSAKRRSKPRSSMDMASSSLARLPVSSSSCDGVHSSLTWREITPGHLDLILSVNVTGSFLIAQAAAEQIERGGAIVLTSSASVSVGGIGGSGRGAPAYVASKAAIIGLTRALARSFAPLGIRVNAVSPGSTETAMTAEYDDKPDGGLVNEHWSGAWAVQRKSPQWPASSFPTAPAI
jgi:NAD(P)-dependent dehydrogenase (short-subunit alcohol dehydrogenase family)